MTQLVNPLEVLKSISDATTALVQKLAQSVVSVKSHMAQGTGIVLNQEGYIVTCNHVLSGCNAVKIGQGEKTHTATVVGTDPDNDTALLKAEHGSFKPAELADSTKLNTGQFVIALANPFNRRTPTATTGIITNPDAALKHMQGTTIKRGYLGIVTNTVMIPQELADEAGIEQDTGVMIFQVEHDSPAKKAGLTMGGVIVKFNDKPVVDFYDLPRLLADDVVGKETKITILRGEKLVTLTITPTTAEEENDE